jgi:hypothetical protein
MQPDLWVDDHNLNEDGTVTTLAEYARPGVDPQVDQVLLVGDGEGDPRPARVIERTRDGLVVLRLLGRSDTSLSA